MHFIICKLTKLFKRINSNTCKIIAGISFTKESCMGNENIIGRIHLGREEMMSRSKLSEGWGLVSRGQCNKSNNMCQGPEVGRSMAN